MRARDSLYFRNNDIFFRLTTCPTDILLRNLAHNSRKVCNTRVPRYIALIKMVSAQTLYTQAHIVANKVSGMDDIESVCYVRYLLNARDIQFPKTRFYNSRVSRCNLMYIRYIEQRCRWLKRGQTTMRLPVATNATAGI